MDAYVINLDRRPDRWEQLQKDWVDYPELNLIRVSGVEYDPGRVGCARSHLKLVKYAKDHKMPYILVLEDDARPTQHFKKLWKRCLTYLDNHQDEWDIFNGGTSMVSLSKGTAEKLTKIMFKSDWAYGLQFVIYNEKCYDKILTWEDIPGKLEDRPPIDVFYTNIFINLITYAVFPFIAVQRQGNSDILNVYTDYSGSYKHTAAKLKKIMNS
jgi:glycosyl transferase, family 25